MSLVDIAKAKAEAENKAEKLREQRDREWRDGMQKELDKMTAKLMKGLREFNNVETKHGKLKLVRTGSDAAIKLYRGTSTVDEIILNVRCSIVSGTFDGSDDCRDIPYTKPCASVSRPQDDRNYSTLCGHYFYESADSVDKVDAVLTKVAEYLAPLFK